MQCAYTPLAGVEVVQGMSGQARPGNNCSGVSQAQINEIKLNATAHRHARTDRVYIYIHIQGIYTIYIEYHLCVCVCFYRSVYD